LGREVKGSSEARAEIGVGVSRPPSPSLTLGYSPRKPEGEQDAARVLPPQAEGEFEVGAGGP
jgi:hypothetical protein